MFLWKFLSTNKIALASQPYWQAWEHHILFFIPHYKQVISIHIYSLQQNNILELREADCTTVSKYAPLHLQNKTINCGTLPFRRRFKKKNWSCSIAVTKPSMYVWKLRPLWELQRIMSLILWRVKSIYSSSYQTFCWCTTKWNLTIPLYHHCFCM